MKKIDIKYKNSVITITTTKNTAFFDVNGLTIANCSVKKTNEVYKQIVNLINKKD